MAIEMAKTFEPKAAQQRWLSEWESLGYFHADPQKPGESYTIVIPPPNVTGALHMGHALNNTLQDVLIRRRRMQGFNTLWMPGTDHAGIATQAVVERLIMQTEKKTRHDLGREALVAKIWEWKDKYEARILGQLKQMGSSCDWLRTRFTLDSVCARAVRVTFFRMFRDGYITRGKRLVNWDTQLQTSVADDETYTENTKSGFWTFKYPVDGSADTFISFSTTRPETMLGDTAVCVHPSDDRYRELIGKRVLQPHTGRLIPIIADGQLADPTLGTGCVKVTPAHDPNDYNCWIRHPEIGMINILNPDGTINEEGAEFRGMDRYQAREAVTKKMEELGLFVEKSERIVPMPFSDRSKTPIEPYLSDQWFVRMGDRTDGKPGLAQMTMDAVTDGRVRFFPERYAKTYLDWLGEKRDWCISRQLWWGHRIAVWSKAFPTDSALEADRARWTQRFETITDRAACRTQEDNRSLHVCLQEDDSAIIAELHADGFVQSDDVLDTWFSSALWPHSTLGWPEATPELNRYYPTGTLVTSRDIITLWVARMVLTGLYNLGEIPFRHVYITPKILDGFGDTMSKSKGNGVDPLDIIETYGADALRYYVVSIAGETQDSRLPVSNLCPFCGTLVPQKQEHLGLRTKRLVCPGDKTKGMTCGKAFRPGGPWPTDDPELPTAKQAGDRFEVGRNFATKLWNAARFILMNLEGYAPAELNVAELPIEDRWILSRLATIAQAVSAALDAYRFADSAKLIYEFTWSEFCDWYIEMSKARRSDPGCQRVLVGVLDGILRLVHPVMPFVSESIWHEMAGTAPVRGLPRPTTAEPHAVIARWPDYPADLIDPATEAAIAMMQSLISGIREIRNRYQIDREPLDVFVRCTEHVANELRNLSPFVRSMAQLRNVQFGPDTTKPGQSAGVITADFEAYVSLAGLIDVAAEVKRMEKQLAEKVKQKEAVEAKLANEGFVSRAPAEVVQQQRASVADLSRQIEQIRLSITDLNN